jgi:hypothetical protein
MRNCRYILLVYCVLLFFEQATAQKVSPVKITASNANAYRDSLKLKIFGTTSFPYSITPDSVITNVNTIDYYNGFPYGSILYPSGNLDSVDKFVVSINENMADFPSMVKAYLFHPHNGNGKLFIYHSGHCTGVATAEDIFSNNNEAEPGLVIPALLDKGYTVLAVPMLHYRASPQIGVACGFNNHDDLFTDAHYAFPLGFFFKPLIASLNYLGRGNYSSIYMCGLSGGGWTTSVYPAIDSSITSSFPVAGSWPMPLREVFYPGGDYEQTYPPIFPRLLDYHEIYTLACLAPARKMLQINNRYDACCFAGSYQHIYYVDSVAKALQGTGGVFKFYLDETGTKHAITKRSMDVIFTFITGQETGLQVKPRDTVTDLTDYNYSIRDNFIINGTPGNADLKYSLLKAPSWLSLDTLNGTLYGNAPLEEIVSAPDSVSFKAEDSTGRFIIYNYNITRERAAPYFFTKFDDNTTLYCLLPFSNSIQSIEQTAGAFFYFNNPALAVTGIAIENNSLIRMSINLPLTATDLVGYHGYTNPGAITYNNGLQLKNFSYTRIILDGVTKNVAVAGMIRFNTDTGKFEYFNGTSWVNMN